MSDTRLGDTLGSGDTAEAADAAPPAAPEVQRRRRRSPWSSADAGILYAAFAAALMVQTWFRPGRFIASGDSGPMLQGLDGVTRSWTDTLAGSGSSGYRSAALPDGLVFELVTALGLSPTFAQRVWYTIVVVLCAAMVAWLAAALCRSAAATAAAGIIAVIAPFHLTTLPNLLPMITLGAVAAVVGWAIRSGPDRQLHPAWAVLLGVALAPIAKNPPLLVLVSAAMLVSVLAAWRWSGCTLRYLVRCVAWLGAASLFWAVPLVVHYLSGTPGLEIVAQTDVGAWDWTQRNSGPSNVVRLVASWVWGDPDVMGPLAGLNSGAWAIISWALPVAVLASIVVARRRRLALAIGGAAAVLVVLCVGVNPPFGAVNRFLYEHVPGFWLFRQPMSKFGVLLVLAAAVLIALGVDGVVERLREGRARSTSIVGVGAVLAVAIVAFAHPMWTGSVIQGQRDGANQLPPARVDVPAAWHEAGEWLDRAPREGGVAVLPLSGYYQQGTQWGFYGVNDLVSRLTDRPTLNLLPGGYYDPAGSVPRLLHALQSAIDRSDDAAVRRLMSALGLAYIAIRSDLTAVPTTPTADGAELIAAASDLPGLRLAAEFDTVQIFEPTIAETAGPRRVVEVPSDLDDDRLADLIATAPDEVVFVHDDGPTRYGDAWLPSGGVTSHELRTGGGDYLLTTRIRSPLLWEAQSVASPAGGTSLEIRLRSNISVDGTDLHPPTQMSMPVDEDVVAIVVDDRPIVLGDGPTLFGADPGASVGALTGADTLRVDTPDVGLLGNCNNSSGATLEQAGIQAQALDGGVLLRAVDGSACLSVPLPEPEEILGSRIWHVRGDYERISGAATRVCLWIPSSQRCAVGSPRATAESAGTLDFVAATYAGEDPSGASLVLYADASERDDAVTIFRDVTVRSVDLADGSETLPDVPAPSVVRTSPPATMRLTVDQDLAVNYLQPFSDVVQDCNNYDDAAPARNQLSARRLGDGPDTVVELAAARHSACVSATVKLPAGVRHLTTSFEYRSDGPGARWCLRASGSKCIAGGSLRSTTGWDEVQVDVVAPPYSPLATPEDYQLYVYADGAGPGEDSSSARTVQYRRASVRPTFPMVAAVHPLDDGGSESLVVEHTAFGPGWTATSGDGAGLTGHRRVDGWANGWTAPSSATSDVRTSYGPDRLVAPAVWLLPLVLLGAAVAITRDQLRRLRNDGTNRSPS